MDFSWLPQCIEKKSTYLYINPQLSICMFVCMSNFFTHFPWTDFKTKHVFGREIVLSTTPNIFSTTNNQNHEVIQKK